jgi:hypothetical protein
MFKNLRATKARRLILYFSFPLLFLTCKENGSVGAGFIDESKVKIDTVLVSELPLENTDPLLGRLVYSPLGTFNDPLYGNIHAVSLFKPSIILGESNDVPTDAIAVMRLDVDIEIIDKRRTVKVYGNQTSNGSYKVYRIGSEWRGTAFKMSDEIDIKDQSAGPVFEAEIGEFNYSDIDTTGFVEFELDGAWKTDFIQFYNSDEVDRDSTYRFEDFGLVIVPEDDVDKVIYTRFSTSRLLLIDELEQDTTTNVMLDWAYDIDISNGNPPETNLTLSNTFTPFMNFDLTPIAAQITNNNIIRAELVLTPDSTTISTSLFDNQKRTENPPFRVQLGPSNDLAYDLGFNTTNSKGILSDGIYKFDLTGLVNAYLFGDTDISEIYLYAGQNQGYLGFNTFFGFDADETAVPKVLIYYLDGAE